MDVEAVAGVDVILERAAPLILRDEARHNLALGILATTRAHPELYPEIRGWVARSDGVTIGAALRTPPYNLVLVQPVVEQASAALAATIEDDLPGVVGGIPEVDAFASAWAARRGLELAARFEQGVYALEKVIPPRAADGAMRLAGPDYRPLLLEWVCAFTNEVLHGSPEGDSLRQERSIDARLAGGDAGFALWEVEGRAVALAGFGGPTPNGIRIGPVYTPPELRGHGYATSLTAEVTQLQLDRGRRFCFLYTDLANQTSNAIYTRIGYERVCNSREIAFVTRA